MSTVQEAPVPVATGAKKEWYLAAGLKKVGPMTTERVLERMSSRKVPSKTKAWKKGMKEWLPVREIPELCAGLDTIVVSGLEHPRPGVADATEEAEPRVEVATPATQTAGASAVARTIVLDPEAEPDDEAPTLPPVRVETPAPAPTPVEAPKAAPEPATRKQPLVKRTPAAARLSRTTRPFKQEFRIERRDLWRGFALGFDGARVRLILAIVGIHLAAAALVGGAFLLHWAVGLVVALGAGPLSTIAACVGMGALSYQTRRAIETGSTPGVSESFGFALRHAPALVLAPVLVALLALVPPVALGIKAAVTWIPSVGPVITGLTFGVDIALSAATIFLLVTASLAGVFCPIIVAFEETSLVETIRALLGLVRRSVVRIALWSFWPSIALQGLSAILALAAAITVAIPLALNPGTIPFLADVMSGLQGKNGSAAFGGLRRSSETIKIPGLSAKDATRLERPEVPSAPPPPESLAPSIPAGFRLDASAICIAFWLAVVVAIVSAIVLSTSNAVLGFLYVGCRAGNDDLIRRDDLLARRAETPTTTGV